MYKKTNSEKNVRVKHWGFFLCYISHHFPPSKTDFTCECNFDINSFTGHVANLVSGQCDTETCADGETFCLNQGECVDNADGSSWCRCPESTTGEHCETGAKDILWSFSVLCACIQSTQNSRIFYIYDTSRPKHCAVTYRKAEFETILFKNCIGANSCYFSPINSEPLSRPLLLT